MGRALLGGILGGVAMWLIGFIFWGTPLNRLALSVAPDANNAAVQSMLAQQLGPTGTGVYSVPWMGTRVGAELYARGPTALVHYNASGFAPTDPSSLVGGLILGIVVSLLIAFALLLISDPLSQRQRITIVTLLAVAFPAYIDLGQPIFNHAPWSYYIYMFISDMLSFVAAGAIITWLLPKRVEPLAVTPPPSEQG